MSRRRVLVVVTERGDADGVPDALVTTAQGYIEAGETAADPNTLIINLCRTLGYGSDGYYVSLLADARGQQVLPRLETSAGLAEPYSRFRALQEAGIATLDAGEMAVRWRRAGISWDEDSDAAAEGFGPLPLIRENGHCRPAGDDEVEDIIACIGTTPDPRFQAIAAGVYRVWPAPLLRIRVVREQSLWKVAGVMPASPDTLDDEQRRQLVDAVTGDVPALRRGGTVERDTIRASIAVLLDPADPFTASSTETIDRLEQVAATMNVHVARIDASELRRLPEYDALFIRSLTGVTLPSFQFALRAEALDMPVIDDSQSIIRCGNKVFLEELLRREGLPLPKTRIITQHSPWSMLEELGLPFVIKSPDGSFSAGVHKIATREDYEQRAGELLAHSPLLIAQEWLPTGFDWRITVLDGQLLFAARYYMARDHWQIRTEEGGVERYGKVEAVARDEAPAAIVDVALRAARLIGRGIYGVDLKETANGPVVIEVNDNPNLDADYEDAIDGDTIYEDIIRFFLRRIEEEAEAPRRPASATAARARGRARTRTGAGRSRAGTAAAGAADGDTSDVQGAVATLEAERYDSNGMSARAEPPRASDAAAASKRGRSAVSGQSGTGGGAVASSGGSGGARRPADARREAPQYQLFEVAGLELEYPTVDEDLDVVALVEPAFRAIAGRGTSDIELDRVGFSNEIADHVFEVKTLEPVRSLRDADEAIVSGIRRFSEVLQQEWGARLLPTAMHPWFDPQDGRLWTRSGLRIYTTYAQIFDIRTHGWMNVHATHLNLPFGSERETMAMHTAAAMLVPYLPAIAASSPVHDGRLQSFVDGRLGWILQHQSRIPETCGRIVPEYVDSFAGYRRDILHPMYAALDRFPHSSSIRHEFLNSRGAVLRFARRALEVRVIDTQECVRMDVAIAVFTRAALRQLTTEVLAGTITPPPSDTLVADFHECVRDGSRALVRAPHITGITDGPGVGVTTVLRSLLERSYAAVEEGDSGYLPLIEQIIAQGTLSERIRARLEPHAESETALRRALREVYRELADCLLSNEPWQGRSLTVTPTP
ncbi:MAG TPA: glutamate-cysteine ligase family protein [Longimicrobiales bacterium]|nr:glutamate-cysteine ligase family protein [Longimicrobiales bacterium]